MTPTNFGPIHFVPGSNSGRYPHCHSLYIEADQKVLIDPSSDRNRLIEILNGPGVDMVWLTHYHEDHIKDLDLFRERELWMSAADAPAIADMDTFIDSYCIENPAEREFWREEMIAKFHYQPRRANRLFSAEEVIDLGGVTVEVIPTPGHTPGHRSFFFREQALLFIGDYDLTRFGPWYGDRYSDIDATIASVKHLRGIPAKIWVVSHESGIFEEEPGELWDQYLNIIDKREAQLLDLLREPRTMDDIVDACILYRKKREPKEFYDLGERLHMGKHLDRLLRQGLVVHDGDTYQGV